MVDPSIQGPPSPLPPHTLEVGAMESPEELLSSGLFGDHAAIDGDHAAIDGDNSPLADVIRGKTPPCICTQHPPSCPAELVAPRVQ